MKKPVANPAKKPRTPQPSAAPEEKRGKEDRRKAKSDGYTYVPIVGWYCRRNQTRRSDDSVE
jgi:hypothetical protein